MERGIVPAVTQVEATSESESLVDEDYFLVVGPQGGDKGGGVGDDFDVRGNCFEELLGVVRVVG